MIVGIKFSLNDSLFIRDPQDTELGKKIIQSSIDLIHEVGFEKFTFKKLGKKISSTEASIYRYFTNKHMLLLFLNNWYWEWVKYLIQMNTLNIDNASKRMRLLLKSIVYASTENAATAYVNENKLHKIIINEGGKSYHTAAVDDENKQGLFSSFKVLVEVISDNILAVDPHFLYPHSLASNIFEMANNQSYFSEHLPRLTDIKSCETQNEDIVNMLEFFISRLLTGYEA
jgi:AcrR family transcriptional regulator